MCAISKLTSLQNLAGSTSAKGVPPMDARANGTQNRAARFNAGRSPGESRPVAVPTTRTTSRHAISSTPWYLVEVARPEKIPASTKSRARPC